MAGDRWEEAAIYRPDGPLVALINLDHGRRRFTIKELDTQEPIIGQPLLLDTGDLPAGLPINILVSAIEHSGEPDGRTLFRFAEAGDEEYDRIPIRHPSSGN